MLRASQALAAEKLFATFLVKAKKGFELETGCWKGSVGAAS
jgi:hypothetical protein